MIFKKKQDAAAQQAAAGEARPAGKDKVAAFFRKNWKWMVPVVCVAVLGGWFILRPDRAQDANVDVSYVQTTPEKRDLSNSLSGTGTLNPANTYNVKSLVAGKVLTSTIEEGDIVEEGTVLYTVDASDATTKAEQASITLQQAQRSYDKTVDRQYVRAEVAGVVATLKVAKGDEVTSGQEVAVIHDSSKMVLQLEFPAADAAAFSVGQSAEVTLDGTFETLTGTVTAVTGTDALSTGNLLTRTVTITVRNAGGLTTAQAATATINGVSCIKRSMSLSGSTPLLRSIAIFKPDRSLSSRISEISRSLPLLTRSAILSIIASMVVVYGISLISIRFSFLTYSHFARTLKEPRPVS